MIDRRNFLASCTAGCFYLATGFRSAGQSCERPNVVIILSDDQGWGDFSLHGNRNLNTPNLDGLARSGARFENFYVCAVCSPTRAELLTGRYHVRGGVRSTSSGGERLNLDETTFADLFKQAGYATAAYGKWHNGMQYPYHPNGRGFDDFYGFCSGHWGDYFDPMLEHNGRIVTGSGYLPDDLTERGLEFIDRNRGGAFLLYLPYNIPHSPMQVPDEFWNRFKDKSLTMGGGNDFTKAALAMCENIDWNVGRVIDKISECGLAEKTIVIYMNDNGPNKARWNGGMRGIKGSTDEGGVRSPLFVKWPGRIEAGKKVEAVAGAIDLLPTLTELCGVEAQPDKCLDGRSLAPLLLREQTDWDDRCIFNVWKGKLSVRSQNYRLDANGRLYDIRTDRGQEHDVARLHPQVALEMQAAARKFRAEVMSKQPRNDKRPFPVGHPDMIFTHLPARDGIARGNIKRSNAYPNCSYFTNWTSLEDKIIWDVEVVADGSFDVVIYYTCPEGEEGSVFELSAGASELVASVTEAHVSPLIGKKHDRVRRTESYAKDFRRLKAGGIELKKGRYAMTLRAVEIKNREVMDFRLMTFERRK